jgi:glycolate oxidase iron-sulfur subunit
VREPTAAPEQLGTFDRQDPPTIDGLRACVHCGICLPQCPTYRLLGEEMDSPRGRVYLVRAAAEGRTELTPGLARHLDLCLGCRACETACPSGVPFGHILEAARGQLERKGVRPPERRQRTLELALRTFPDVPRLARLMGALRLYQRSGLRGAVRRLGILRLAPELQAMEALLPDIPAAASPPAFTPARGARRGRAALLLGCVQRFVYPHVNVQTARLLAAAGWDVVAPPEQGCCGALHLHAGRIDDFRSRARELLGTLGRDVDVIVTNAAGCGSALKDCAYWLAGDGAVGRLPAVRDVTEVLAEAELPLRELPGTVAYHDACHLAHGQRVRAEPRALLRRIPGLTLVDLAESDLCCGSAGIYNLLEPEIAGELARGKVQRIRESGARMLAAGNPGCLMQIERQCRAEGLAVEVVHTVELLGRALAE